MHWYFEDDSCILRRLPAKRKGGTGGVPANGKETGGKERR